MPDSHRLPIHTKPFRFIGGGPTKVKEGRWEEEQCRWFRFANGPCRRSLTFRNVAARIHFDLSTNADFNTRQHFLGQHLGTSGDRQFGCRVPTDARSAGFGKVGSEGAGKTPRRDSQCILTLRHRGRLYTDGVSDRTARTITVPLDSGEPARWKWLLPRLRKLRVSRCSSEHRPRRRLREGLFRACREDALRTTRASQLCRPSRGR